MYQEKDPFSGLCIVSHFNCVTEILKQTNKLPLQIYLPHTSGPGGIRTKRFNNECSLHSTANYMLIIALAGFNIEPAVME